MISYQATLPAPPADVVAVRASPVRDTRTWLLGGDLPIRTFRVTVRYALADGRVQTHRGLVRAAVSPDRPLRVVAWQVDGSVVTVTLMAAARLREGRGVRCLADRFSLPLVGKTPGSRFLEVAEAHVQATAQGQGDVLLVRGVVMIRLLGPGVEVPVRIPFGRLLAIGEAGELSWQVRGGVAGMQLSVGAHGEIRGKVVLEVVYEESRGWAEPERETIGIRQVREITATVVAAKAEPAGNDLVLVHGTVDVDVYWVDSHHRSRWAGVTVPFSGVARLPGVQGGDRLEVQARVERIRPVPGHGMGTAMLLVSAAVTQLRPKKVTLGEGCYLVEEVLGQFSLSMEQTVRWADPAWLFGGVPEEVRVVPEFGLPGPWRELSVEVGARTGPGDRWRLQVGLRGVMVPVNGQAGADGEAGRWRRTGAREGNLPSGCGSCALALPAIGRVGPEGLSVRMAVVPVATALCERAPRRLEVARLDVPGAVRWVLGLRGEGGRGSRVQVLVAGEGEIRLVEGPVAEPRGHDRPGALTVYPLQGRHRGLVVVGEY